MKDLNTKTFSADQKAIVDELCQTHGLEPTQISFEGAALNPIFDYEAVGALSLKLTNIQTIHCEIKHRPNNIGISTAVCTVFLPNGRSRSTEDTAEIGEIDGNGRKIENRRDAENLAQNRAVRRGIRSVGIDLYKAHKAFLKTGEPTDGSTEEDPRVKLIKEVHATADDLQYSVEEYQELLSSGYGGRTSCSSLDDKELEGFARSLRVLLRIQKSRQEHFKQAA